MERVFRLKPEAFWKAHLPGLLCIAGAMGAMVAGVFWYQQVPPSQALVLIALFAAVGFAAAKSGVQRWRALWNGYELAVSDDHIELRSGGSPVTVLERDQVVAIAQRKDGPVVVQARQAKDSIAIPAQVENRPALMECLAGFGPLTHRGASWTAYVLLLVGMLGTLAAFAGTFYAKNLWIVVPCAGLMIGICAIGAVMMRRDRRIDPKVRKWAWVCAFPIVGAITRVVWLVQSNGMGR